MQRQDYQSCCCCVQSAVCLLCLRKAVGGGGVVPLVLFAVNFDRTEHTMRNRHTMLCLREWGKYFLPALVWCGVRRLGGVEGNGVAGLAGSWCCLLWCGGNKRKRPWGVRKCKKRDDTTGPRSASVGPLLISCASCALLFCAVLCGMHSCHQATAPSWFRSG